MIAELARCPGFGLSLQGLLSNCLALSTMRCSLRVNDPDCLALSLVSCPWVGDIMSSYKCLQKITSHDVTEQAQLHRFLSIWKLPAYVNNKFGGFSHLRSIYKCNEHQHVQLSGLLRLCSSPTGPVGLIRSNLESGRRQVHSKGCKGFGKGIDQHPEEDTKCL